MTIQGTSVAPSLCCSPGCSILSCASVSGAGVGLTASGVIVPSNFALGLNPLPPGWSGSISYVVQTTGSIVITVDLTLPAGPSYALGLFFELQDAFGPNCLWQLSFSPTALNPGSNSFIVETVGFPWPVEWLCEEFTDIAFSGTPSITLGATVTASFQYIAEVPAAVVPVGTLTPGVSCISWINGSTVITPNCNPPTETPVLAPPPAISFTAVKLTVSMVGLVIGQTYELSVALQQSPHGANTWTSAGTSVATFVATANAETFVMEIGASESFNVDLEPIGCSVALLP